MATLLIPEEFWYRFRLFRSRKSGLPLRSAHPGCQGRQKPRQWKKKTRSISCNIDFFGGSVGEGDSHGFPRPRPRHDAVDEGFRPEHVWRCHDAVGGIKGINGSFVVVKQAMLRDSFFSSLGQVGRPENGFEPLSSRAWNWAPSISTCDATVAG